MKTHNKFILTSLLLLVLSFNTFGQDQDQKTLTVTGNALVERTITKYRAKITLNLDQGYYSNPECQTIEDFKELYFKKLRAKGFDSNNLVENEMESTNYGYQKGGTSFSYETPDKKAITLLSAVRMNGVTTSYSFKYAITPQQGKALRKKAFEDALENAKQLAEATSVEIGDIVSVSERKAEEYIWTSYHQNHAEYASVYLSFLIK